MTNPEIDDFVRMFTKRLNKENSDMMAVQLDVDNIIEMAVECLPEAEDEKE